MTEKRFEVYYSKSKRNWYVRDNTGEIKCFGCADSEIAEYICNEWNKLNDENEQLKQSINNLMDSNDWWEKKAKQRVQELEKENEQLKKELFESEKDYLMETYSDNPIRRDDEIQSLKEEFKARFGDVE